MTTKRCPKCKSIYPATDSSCPSCGAKFGVHMNDTPRIVRSPDAVVTSQNVPKCPTCGSNDISRIKTSEKIGSIVAFGLFSSKRNKQFKCNNCKYMW